MRHFFAPCAAFALLFAGAAHADIYRTWDPKTGTVTYTNIKPTGPHYELVVRERRSEPPPQAVAARPASRAYLARTSRLYAGHIEAAARAYRLEPELIRAVITAESGHDPLARSPAGAVGLMQLMPGTAQRYGVTNRQDPAQSIHGGARYLRDLMDMFGNDLQLVLAAYNAGEEAVMRYGRRIPPYRETMAYVPKVLQFYRQYRGVR